MNDRLSMAFSRELREPYLDHRIVEFLFRLSGRQKIRMGQSKYLLRHAMAGRLPDKVRLARKRGVVTPQRESLCGRLRPQVEDVIHSRSFAERGLFAAEKVEAAYNRFCSGDGDNSFFVWQWINTELWFRTFIDEKALP
jgi:asparagine synthase (glutamine-hydrolysing)